MPPPIELPDVVRRRAISVGAHAWLHALPALVASLEQEWSIRAGRALADGSEAYVAEVSLADGTPAVMKLLVPGVDESLRHEILALQLAGGEGCARLLRSDVSRGALLIERLGRSLADLGLPYTHRLEIMCDTAMKVWRPAAGHGLPTGAAKGRWLIDFITTTWEELARPCSERAVAYAISCAERRIAAHDDERSVLVHGDVHEWNTLEAGDAFKLIDPDGLLAGPEYDLGTLLRLDPAELIQSDPMGRARMLAARARLNPQAIWEWGAVERVSTGLVCTKLDLQPSAREILAAAEIAARHEE